MPSYLQKRRRRWYCVLEIPKDQRHRFGGKRRWVQSLGTDSLAEAESRKHAILAGWKAQLADDDWPDIDWTVRGKTFSRPLTSPAVLAQKLRNATTEGERDAILHQIEDAASYMGAICR